MAQIGIHDQQLQRSMKSRHLFMIALGGVIGTGLFQGSGYTINTAGPLGAVLSYLVGGFVMYLTMLCLGELTVAMPEAGSFQSYATRFISPAVGFTVGWVYWLNWALTVGLELTSIGMTIRRWLPYVPVWVWCALFAFLLFLFNAFSARSYAELEFWFSSIKVITIVLFIILGGAAMFGLLHLKGAHSAPMFTHFTKDGLLPNGIVAILMTMITVNFSFQGTELVGIASGESENPEKTIPKAIRNTVWRTLFFFVLAMTVLAALIPWQKAGVMESPFVYVLDQMGIPYAADIMNFVILTALLSVANSGLYASSRMLWSMSKDGMAPSFFSKLTGRGIPIRALLASLAVALLSLLTSVYAADTVYLWLISASGMGAVVVWISIAASQFFFRKRFLAEGGKLEELKYRTPLYPVVPILAFALNTIVLFSMGLIPDQRIALICGIPLMVIIYLSYMLKQKFGSQAMKTSREAPAQTGTE
ncbi:amino acid permease [Polycladomyces subterraneus]|uniref:Amino acid permease n=1 Tax=Polycladomyces subterraneus TaxID=1016997 RepID=A0ABT8IPC1_9BACL|nr:amino acid permease [Polycladomyces subterraneus]MDN4594630.1 amino acid permease [Polycladomyces subterraneus]